MEIWGGSEQASNAISTPGIDFWVHSVPYRSEAAGGDLHYVSVCGSGRYIRAALADVSGHGAAVEELAVTLRGLMRRHINTPDQSRFARALNNEFARLELDGKFATAILTTYHSPSGSLVMCNAGHPRPLIRRAADGSWSHLSADERQSREATGRGLRNLPLGIIKGAAYKQFAAPLEEGDSVILYTDALIEAADEDGRQLGEAGLLDIVRRIDRAVSGEALVESVLERVQRHKAKSAWDDDVTIVHIQRNGARPQYSVGERMVTLARLLGLKKV